MRWVHSSILGLALFSFVPAALGAEPAAADPEPPGEAIKVTAEDLFQQGVKLTEQNKWADAAAKFEESNRLERAPGTTIYLADCQEKLGKLASAWTLFVEAATIFGRRSPPDARAQTAKERGDALYPKLSRLTIEVPEAARVPGLVIKRDGIEVGKAQFATGIAVDAGKHLVEAAAPGRKPWRVEVSVPGDAGRAATTVPVLGDAPVAVSGDGSWHWQRKVAIAAGGAGLTGLVVGAIFGVDALGKHDALGEHCAAGNPRICDAEGVAIAGDQKTSGTVSTIGFAAGGALVAAGVVLWLSAPAPVAGGTPAAGVAGGAKKRERARVWIVPHVGVHNGFAAGMTW